MSGQLAEQGEEILGQLAVVQRVRSGGQADDQIDRRQFGPPAPELVADHAFDPVAVDGPFQQFLADDQTEPGATTGLARLIVQHQPAAANRPPETKNG